MELLEILGNANDAFWQQFLKIFKPVSDNVWVIVTFISILISFIIAVGLIKVISCQYKNDEHITKKFLTKRYLFLSFPIYGIVLSLTYMIDRLPMIHQRIQTALSTTASIIMSSETYSDAFEHATNVTIEGSRSIAEYLYFHVVQGVNPSELYEHLYSTLEKTRKIPFIRCINIHEVPIDKFSILILLVSFIAIIWLTIGVYKIKIYKDFGYFYHIGNGLFLLYLMGRNYGAVYSFLLIQVVIYILVYFFGVPELGNVSKNNVENISESEYNITEG